MGAFPCLTSFTWTLLLFLISVIRLASKTIYLWHFLSCFILKNCYISRKLDLWWNCSLTKKIKSRPVCLKEIIKLAVLAYFSQFPICVYLVPALLIFLDFIFLSFLDSILCLSLSFFLVVGDAPPDPLSLSFLSLSSPSLPSTTHPSLCPNINYSAFLFQSIWVSLLFS